MSENEKRALFEQREKSEAIELLFQEYKLMYADVDFQEVKAPGSNLAMRFDQTLAEEKQLLSNSNSTNKPIN